MKKKKPVRVESANLGELLAERKRSFPQRRLAITDGEKIYYAKGNPFEHQQRIMRIGILANNDSPFAGWGSEAFDKLGIEADIFAMIEADPAKYGFEIDENLKELGKDPSFMVL